MGWKDRALPVEEEAKPSWMDRASEVPVDIDSSPPTTPEISAIESGARGLAQGGSLGFADELSGGAEALWNKAQGDPAAFGELYKRYRDESRGNFRKAEDANPKTFTAGEFAGGIGTALVPGLNAMKGATLAKTAATGALQGGLAGLGSSNEEAPADIAEDIAKGATIGVGGGALGYGLTRGLAGSADNLSEFAERMAARGLGAERGTIKKLGDEKVREAGRYALDSGITGEGLKSGKNPLNWIFPQEATQDMISKNEGLKREAGQGMQMVYDQIDEKGLSTFNPMEAASRIAGEMGDFWRSPINKGEAKQFDNMIEAILQRGQGNIPINEAQVLKQELGKVANWKNNLAVTDKENMARQAYGIVSDMIDQSVDKASKQLEVGKLPEILSKSKADYASGKAAETLLDNRQAREQGNKLFGLTDTIAAAGGLFGGPVSSAAAVGAKKGIENYGPQAAALVTDKLANIVRTAPQQLGKFAKPLEEAARRGPQALAVTHFLLQQQSPEYHGIARKLEGNEER